MLVSYSLPLKINTFVINLAKFSAILRDGADVDRRGNLLVLASQLSTLRHHRPGFPFLRLRQRLARVHSLLRSLLRSGIYQLTVYVTQTR